MMTVVVSKSDVEIVARLGHEYLRTCKVAEWQALPDGRWAPKAWHVPEESVEQSRVDPTRRIVYADDKDTTEKLGISYLRTCKVAAWSDQGFPSAWIVPAEVLDLPEVSYERRSVFKGDLSVVRKLGKDFLKYCLAGKDEWAVPIFVLDQIGLVPLDREEADEARRRMSKAQESSTQCPERTIAEENIDQILDVLPLDADPGMIITFACQALAWEREDRRFWLPRQTVAEKLGIEKREVDWWLRRMQRAGVIVEAGISGKLKVFKFLKQDAPKSDEPVILKFAEAI